MKRFLFPAAFIVLATVLSYLVYWHRVITEG